MNNLMLVFTTYQLKWGNTHSISESLKIFSVFVFIVFFKSEIIIYICQSSLDMVSHFQAKLQKFKDNDVSEQLN